MNRPLASSAELEALLRDLSVPDDTARAKATARQMNLTKPPGSLGRLEELAIWLAGWQGTERPRVERIETLVFAGNHGVTARGISPYPPEVTAQMVANFEAGGAAISQLARSLGAKLRVVPFDLDTPTGDISREAAMSQADCLAALNAGMAAVEGCDLIVLGEMGIGNTTVAAALAAVSCGGTGSDWAGAGTGLDADGISLKARVVDEALALHAPHAAGPFETLRRLGGREEAALAGALVAARLKRIPAVLDGFVCTAAAAVLWRHHRNALDHCVAGHVSSEQGHAGLLAALGLKPLIDLGMRLGEGSGAALGALVLKAAAACHEGMATFEEAGVSKSAEAP